MKARSSIMKLPSFPIHGIMNQPASRVLVLRLFGLFIASQSLVFLLMIIGGELLKGPSSFSRGLLQPTTVAIMSENFVMNRTMASTCFTMECLEHTAWGLVRAYPERTDQNWCIESGRKKDGQDKWQGLLLVKVPKGASSTAAGVSLRISRTTNARSKRPCRSIQWQHQKASTYKDRVRTKSFLWTTVRDPAERAISTIFFHNVSRRRVEKQTHVPDADIIDQLRNSDDEHSGATSRGQGGFQLRYISFRDVEPYSFWNASRPKRVRHPTGLQNLIKETLARYDFIAVTDRMDESLVAMALLMGIPVSDVLVTSSKVAGQHYQLVHLPKNQMKCLPTVPSYVSPPVKRFLDSDIWRAANWGDYILHKAASLSLDRTIATVIGQERFESALAEFRNLKEMEKMYCAPSVEFPCSDDGTPQPEKSKESCYLQFYDFGCGYRCIDHLVQEQKSIF